MEEAESIHHRGSEENREQLLVFSVTSVISVVSTLRSLDCLP
jgi:hypothetical protein